MVSTRSQSSAFPPPDASPTRRATSKDPTPGPTSLRGPTSNNNGGSWHHAPQRAIIYWLYFSLPLVTWETSYVFLRPHSMPGGKLHWPIFSPYEIFCDVDYNYGFPGWDAGTGFLAAQSLLNVPEVLLSVAYLAVVMRNGSAGSASAKKVVKGTPAAKAVLLGFTAAVMTLSKTIMFFAKEYYSGFKYIGHNDWVTLFASWIIPNTLWLIFPSYMVYSFGTEISRGLEAASGVPSKKVQ